jgi:shikimate dehydrogenase
VARRAAVLGSPIAHSLSPVLHRAAYGALGIDWDYDAVECTADALPGLLDRLDDTWAGVSLTMPLKRVVLPLLDARDPLVDEVGAANTVLLTGGARRGFNTDVEGVIAALAEVDGSAAGPATVLGAGGTAAATLAALRRAGHERVTVVVRTSARARELGSVAERLGLALDVRHWPGEPADWAGALVISTVPAGATDGLAGALPGVPAVVLDVVYAPWPTAFAQHAAAAGATVVGGLPVLVHQAAAQVTLMTGLAAPVEVMRAAGEAALAGA